MAEGAQSGQGGDGGIAVYGSNLTITNSGTIRGGLGGDSGIAGNGGIGGDGGTGSVGGYKNNGSSGGDGGAGNDGGLGGDAINGDNLSVINTREIRCLQIILIFTDSDRGIPELRCPGGFSPYCYQSGLPR